MLEQVELEYRIKNNGELMESLGYIEEKINDLIAAKVNSKLKLFNEMYVHSCGSF